jgi:hypothetical protein
MACQHLPATSGLSLSGSPCASGTLDKLQLSTEDSRLIGIEFDTSLRRVNT